MRKVNIPNGVESPLYSSIGKNFPDPLMKDLKVDCSGFSSAETMEASPIGWSHKYPMITIAIRIMVIISP